MGARLHTPDTLIPPPALALAALAALALAAAHYPKLLRFTLPEPRSESGEPISVQWTWAKSPSVANHLGHVAI